MSVTSCGIDFGTSNSSAAIASQDKVELVPVEGNSITIPSAIFYQRTGTFLITVAKPSIFFLADTMAGSCEVSNAC